MANGGITTLPLDPNRTNTSLQALAQILQPLLAAATTQGRPAGPMPQLSRRDGTVVPLSDNPDRTAQQPTPSLQDRLAELARQQQQQQQQQQTVAGSQQPWNEKPPVSLNQPASGLPQRVQDATGAMQTIMGMMPPAAAPAVSMHPSTSRLGKMLGLGADATMTMTDPQTGQPTQVPVGYRTKGELIAAFLDPMSQSLGAALLGPRYKRNANFWGNLVARGVPSAEHYYELPQLKQAATAQQQMERMKTAGDILGKMAPFMKGSMTPVWSTGSDPNKQVGWLKDAFGNLTPMMDPRNPTQQLERVVREGTWTYQYDQTTGAKIAADNLTTGEHFVPGPNPADPSGPLIWVKATPGGPAGVAAAPGLPPAPPAGAAGAAAAPTAPGLPSAPTAAAPDAAPTEAAAPAMPEQQGGPAGGLGVPPPTRVPPAVGLGALTLPPAMTSAAPDSATAAAPTPAPTPGVAPPAAAAPTGAPAAPATRPGIFGTRPARPGKPHEGFLPLGDDPAHPDQETYVSVSADGKTVTPVLGPNGNRIVQPSKLAQAKDLAELREKLTTKRQTDARGNVQTVKDQRLADAFDLANGALEQIAPKDSTRNDPVQIYRDAMNVVSQTAIRTNDQYVKALMKTVSDDMYAQLNQRFKITPEERQEIVLQQILAEPVAGAQPAPSQSSTQPDTQAPPSSE